MALSQDLEIPLGDTWRSPRWALVVGDTVVDLADGWTVRAQARYPGGRSAVLYSWTVDGGGIEFGTADFTVAGETVTGSTVRLKIGATESEAMGEWRGEWDLEVSHPTFDGGQLWRKTLVRGQARTVADVTR